MKTSAWGIFALCALAASVHADPRDAAGAQALFDEGMALMKAHSFAKACPKLAESQRLDPGIGTQFHLAECYEGQGLFASAWAQFLEVASLAGASGQADRQQAARKRAARLEPRLGRIRIGVPASRRVAGLTVERDGIAVREASWDSSVPVDPGEHQITVSAAGYKSFNTKVSVQEGQTAAVDVPQLETDTSAPAEVPSPAAPTVPMLPASAPAAVAAPAAQSTDSASTRSADNAPPPAAGMGPVVIGLGALGIAGVGVGTVFGIMANSKFKSSKGACNPTNEDRCSDEGIRLRDDSITLANVSTIGFIAGGAALAGATLVLLTRGNSKAAAGHDSSRLTTVVRANPTRASLAIEGTF